MKRDVVAISFALRDPECPRAAKALAWVVVCYALSPIDLIPDAIPVLGILDDLILVPLGVLAVQKMLPPQVMARARAQAADKRLDKTSKVGLAIVLTIWVAFIVLGVWVWQRWRR